MKSDSCLLSALLVGLASSAPAVQAKTLWVGDLIDARVVATKSNERCERDCWEMWRADALGLFIVMVGSDGRIQTVKTGRGDLAKVFTPEHDRTKNVVRTPIENRMGRVTSVLAEESCTRSCTVAVDFGIGSMLMFIDSQGQAAFASAWQGSELVVTRSGSAPGGIVPFGDQPCTGSNKTSCTDWLISTNGSIVIVVEYDRYGNPIGYEIYVDGKLIDIGGGREAV